LITPETTPLSTNLSPSSLPAHLFAERDRASGRFAAIDSGLGFSLVPRRPIIEKEIGHEVIGVVRGGGDAPQVQNGPAHKELDYKTERPHFPTLYVARPVAIVV